MQRQRIMVVGQYMWPWYQEACAMALERLGCAVERFGWFGDFHSWRTGQLEPVYHSFLHRLQARIHAGPTVWKIQQRLVRRAKKIQPDIVWFYNVQLISPGIVKVLKKVLPRATFAQYANDNPFSCSAQPGLWRNFIASVPLFDVHFSFRLNNIEDYKKYGARTVHLLRAYFIPNEDYPVPRREIPNRFKCDVVFAGHYEADDRVQMLEAICHAGLQLNLYGGGWDKALSRLRPDSPLRKKYPINPVTGQDYRKAICGSKVALCFLSTLNRDTYTRRSFQIPAMKTTMLSQYTADLQDLYVENKEIVFFRNKAETVHKLKTLLKNETWRRSVAEAGYAKVYNAGHDVQSRMRVWLEQIEHWQKSNLEKHSH